jgi:AraC-like DNA-binding protein
MDVRIRKIVTFLEENVHLTLRPDQIAQVVNLSPPRLRALFRAETGEPLARYQKALKMREARRLLRETFLSVKEITLKVGVNDESHFVRDFKRACGLTPMQYRARCKEALEAAEPSRAGD